MKQILEIEKNTIIQEDVARNSWCRKSHNYYEPGKQITRNCKKSFDKCVRFDKPLKSQGSESRIRKLLTWINHEPVTLVNCRQADFIKRTKSFVGQVKDLETSRLYMDAVHGRKTVKDESNIFNDFNVNEQTRFWWQCLQDLNNFRQKLKKRIPEVSFVDIEDDFSCLDKVSIYQFINVLITKYSGVLSEDKIFLIFKKHRIYPNKEFLTPLMDTLQLRKDGYINYRELLNLLNWKRSLPVLPTTKLELFNRIRGVWSVLQKIHAAGLPSERTDFLLTIKNTEHIVSENIDFEFPENSFDMF
ncbi:hypothetical protein P5V15_014185 [Pogonomyrmex californicus]